MRSRPLSAAVIRLLVRPLAALAIIAGALGCGTLGAHGRVPSRTTLEFDNQSSDPVRVYLLVEEGGQFLLGRVYPMQQSSLTLPRHLPPSDMRRVSLVVVPIGSPELTRRISPEDMSRQVVGSVAELSMQRFVITPATMHGVLAARQVTP